ncbi:Strabismus domain containing protein [Aphelenchoides bicaudatus]|nr:Strabismus domain containing protein [Aphelenchoides bicaudatus]
MSVVSQRIGHPYRSSNRHGRPVTGTQSVVNGYDFDRSPLILPGFSGIDERSVKLDMDVDNTTVVTSEHSYCGALPERYNIGATSSLTKSKSANGASTCGCMSLLRFMFGFVIVFSAAAMIALPFILNFFGHSSISVECSADCEAGLLYIIVLTIALGIAVSLTWSSPPSNMPRLNSSRTSFSLAVVFILASFWLFYTFRTLVKPTVDFRAVLWFAMTLQFLLIILHVLWNSYENRCQKLHFRINVTRDPDGESHELIVTHSSIQEAAVQVLKFYQTHFSTFNPYAEQSRTKGFNSKGAALPSSSFKIYNFERGGEQALNENDIIKLIEVAARQGTMLHNELFGQEGDKERRIGKKRYRLIAATEEAFAQVNSINDEFVQRNSPPIRPQMAVKAVMGAISKPLNRFLKSTLKQTILPPQSIMEHLEFCYQNGLSARVFLSHIFQKTPTIKESVGTSKWGIASNQRASASLQHGQQFILRCYCNVDVGVQLVCSVSEFGFYNLMEERDPVKWH